MKKNILIALLSIIIVFLIYKAMVPTVVTERRMQLQNRYSDTSLVDNIDDGQNANKNEANSDYYEDDYGNYDEDMQKQLPAPRFHRVDPRKAEPEQEEFQEPEEEFDNTPIRFRKNEPADDIKNYSEQSQQQPQLQQEAVIINEKSSAKISDNSFASSFKTCKPYKETMNSEYMGIKMNYSLEILGWINNKCTLNFTSKALGVGETFGQEYGIDPSDAIITTFAPNIKCEFSKTQLLYVGDSILQEKERNKGASNNMLKNPNKIVFPEFENMSASDLKLLQVVFADKACKIQNLEELKNLFKGLQEY